MSHVRIWRSNGIVYFSGQMPATDVTIREGQFRDMRAAVQLQLLATDFAVPVAAEMLLRTDAKDQ